MSGSPTVLSAGEHENEIARQIFSGLPRHYDALAEVLSFGQNRRWRKTMVDRIAAADPATILDVATGTAGVALDQAGNDVHAHVTVKQTDDLLHPMKVSARSIKNRMDAVLLK